jgi:hypothetical protein
MNSQDKSPNFFLNLGRLHMIAKRACARAYADGRPNDKEDAALTAVLFSAAALEAYINETAQLIHKDPRLSKSSSKVSAFAEVLDEAEHDRASLRLKFLLAKTVLSGHSFDRGALPYQDFDLLIALRNELMHSKLQRIDDTHRLVKCLRSRQILGAEDANVRSSWISTIATPEVARWACDTAASMVNAIQEALSKVVPDQSRPSEIRTLATFRLMPIDTGDPSRWVSL